MQNIMTLLPIIAFIVGTVAIGFVVQRRSEKARAENYSKDYYIGGRKLGGLVLAMTLVATYGSVSSFVGGPGQAWNLGFGWLYYASIQIAAAYLVLGVLGKKIAIVGRKIDAVTLPDLIRHRYQSNTLARVTAVVMMIFFTTQMVAQFIGGAKLFEAATGYPYIVGLVLFGVATIIYTSVGGFNAVAITDTICAIFMIVGMLILAYATVHAGGGFSQIMMTLSADTTHFDPFAGGQIGLGLLLSGWVLIGFGLIGLPQSAVRCLSYKDTKSLHRAMLYGTVALGVMIVGMHLLGVLSRGVITDGTITDVDGIIPSLVVQVLPPLVAGLVICGPLAASMSTISSLLIAASSALVKDIYQHDQEEIKGKKIDSKKISRISMSTTFFIGIIVFIFAIKPPSLIVWINLFAFGGLQSAFVWVLLLGMFWKRGNTEGGLAGMLGGTAVYLILSIAGVNWFGMHNIVWGLLAGLIFYVGASLATKPMDDTIGKIYFPEKY